MKTFSVNGKSYKADDKFLNIGGLVFKSNVSYLDIDFKSNIRSITDLIIYCISKDMSEKDISNQFDIDLISIQGKVKIKNAKEKDRFFELKNKKVCLTDKAKDRLVLIQRN